MIEIRQKNLVPEKRETSFIVPWATRGPLKIVAGHLYEYREYNCQRWIHACQEGNCGLYKE